MITTIEGDEIYANVQYDKKVKCLVSTCSTTHLGIPYKNKLWRNENGETIIFYKAVKRQKMSEDYFEGASVIDIDNHFRQDRLELEKVQIRRIWEYCIFSMLLGVSECDSYLAYCRLENREMSHKEYATRLTYSLLTNSYVGILKTMSIEKTQIK